MSDKPAPPALYQHLEKMPPPQTQTRCSSREGLQNPVPGGDVRLGWYRLEWVWKTSEKADLDWAARFQIPYKEGNNFWWVKWTAPH